MPVSFTKRTRFCSLLTTCEGAGRAPVDTIEDETVQSTSMFRKISLALLAGASSLGAGLDQASAIDVAEFSQPSVIYARPPTQAPMRTAAVQRSNMGGGFIEFLFGDGPQSPRYQQAPMYQQQPSYDPHRPLLPQSEPSQQQDQAIDGAQQPLDPVYEK